MLTVGQGVVKRPRVHRRSERGQTRMLTVGQDAAMRPLTRPSARMFTVAQNATKRPSARMLAIGQDAAMRPQIDRRSGRGQAPAC